ncbi:MAG: peptidoglycan-binding domain-containing protein, partial [Gemmobacter sp.]
RHHPEVASAGLAQLAGEVTLRMVVVEEAQADVLAERMELQERLTRMGFDTGGVDGNVGAKTYAAVKAYQVSRGLPPDGFPDRELLEMLRRG